MITSFIYNAIDFLIVVIHIGLAIFLTGWRSWQPIKGLLSFFVSITFSYCIIILIKELNISFYLKCSVASLLITIILAPLFIIFKQYIISYINNDDITYQNKLPFTLLTLFRQSYFPLDYLLNKLYPPEESKLCYHLWGANSIKRMTIKMSLLIPVFTLPATLVSIFFSEVFKSATYLLFQPDQIFITEFFTFSLELNMSHGHGSTLGLFLGMYFIIINPLIISSWSNS